MWPFNRKEKVFKNPEKTSTLTPQQPSNPPPPEFTPADEERLGKEKEEMKEMINRAINLSMENEMLGNSNDWGLFYNL